MGRKNKRKRTEYRDRLGFNPKKYIHEAPGLADTRPYRTPKRGDVWFADLGYHGGTSVQDGCRPVIIVSNDDGNHHADTIVVLPMTSRMKKYYLPSHVELQQSDLSHTDPNRPFEPSMILAEQITTIPKGALRSYLGRVQGEEKLGEINNAVRAQLGITG